LIDLTLVLVGLVGVLLAATTYAAIEYYRQLRRAQKEYEKARNSVEDIVLSFNRELRREAERIQIVNYKAEANAAKTDAGLKKTDILEKRLLPLENQIEAQTSTINDISENNKQTLQKVTQVDSKFHEIEAAQEVLKSKITGLEEQVQKISILPEMQGEPAMPVMPIRRDKAMASLTDTEIAVLEFLTSEGPKTAPEIKEKVHLSREHTARLMKKLYEEGYLERETGKLPFKYSVKKEMERLLKRPENSAA
jgi:chromosome segregation ATPase